MVTYSSSSEICGDRIFLFFTVEADVVVLNLVTHIFNVSDNFPLRWVQRQATTTKKKEFRSVLDHSHIPRENKDVFWWGGSKMVTYPIKKWKKNLLYYFAPLSVTSLSWLRWCWLFSWLDRLPKWKVKGLLSVEYHCSLSLKAVKLVSPLLLLSSPFEGLFLQFLCNIMLVQFHIFWGWNCSKFSMYSTNGCEGKR